MPDRKILVHLSLLLSLIIGGYAMSVTPQPNVVELTIFAAASLSDAFRAIAKDFQALNPEIRIAYNFAGSQQLAHQLAQGAYFDVFAPANMKQMAEATASGRIDTNSIRIFAHNRLVVIVPERNEAALASLRDLSKPGLKIVLADEAVPAGQYALEFLDRYSRSTPANRTFKEAVLKNVASYEENVRAVLGKVALGEADAGLVYTSDISRDTTERVAKIEIPDSLNVIADYPIAVSTETTLREAAEKFESYILSAEGQSSLNQFGFLPAPAKHGSH